VIRVFIVAASPLVRAGLGNLLAARRVEVVGSAGTLDVLAGRLSDSAPDVVLIDSSGESFESLMDSVNASGLVSDVNVAVLGDVTSPGAPAEALGAGIRAWLPGDISPDQLVAALEAAASGLLVLHPAQVKDALPQASGPARALDELAESLTRREREVLQMLAAGLGNKEIAARLGISEHTVKFHVTSILGKLGAGSRTEAVSIGIRRGLVLL
jgi:two-component system, NarL family, response regulator YdfI